MPNRSSLEVVAQMLDERIASLGRKRISNRARATFSRLLSGCLATAVTLLLGFDVGSDRYSRALRNAALVLSGLGAFIQFVDATFGHRALWLEYTDARTKLKALRAEATYLEAVGDHDERANADRLFNAMQAVLTASHATWASLRRTSGTQESRQPELDTPSRSSISSPEQGDSRKGRR